MPICKFYQNGNCKNGNRCRFDHVKVDEGRSQPSRDRYDEPRNPFDSAIRQPEPRGYHDPPRGGHSQGRSNDRRTPDYGSGPRAGRFFIDEQLTRTDLINERPEWPLSCYTGAGQGCTDSPRHLIGGAIEQSPEEVRTAFYLARVNGQEEQAQRTEFAAAQAANSEIEKVVTDMKGAIQYAVNGKREPDSRWVIVDESNKQTATQNRGVFAKDSRRPTQAAPASSGGFGAPSAGFSAAPAPTQSSGFGRPSAPSAFGQPSAPSAFGQPSVPSAFGQPSALAQPSAFGKPSVPTQASGFGQPSQLGHAPAFGKPSAPGGFGAPSGGFGQPSALGQTTSPFGKPSPLGQTSAFGQPSNLAQDSVATNRPQAPAFGSATPFGQASSAPSPFGQPSSQPAGGAANPFGQPSAPASQNSPFGQPSSQPASGAVNPFGQPSAPVSQNSPFGAQKPQASPFGQPSTPQQNPSSFGQPTQPQANPFSQQSHPPTQSPFSQPQQPSSGSGQPPNPFGQPSAPGVGGFGQPQANAFAKTPQHQQANGFGVSKPSALPSLNTAQPARSSGPLNMSPQDPNAPPRPEDPPEELFGGNKAAFEEAYHYVREHGTFKDGIMPEVAPMHYWVGWGAQEKKFKN